MTWLMILATILIFCGLLALAALNTVYWHLRWLAYERDVASPVETHSLAARRQCPVEGVESCAAVDAPRAGLSAGCGGVEDSPWHRRDPVYDCAAPVTQRLCHDGEEEG